MKRAIALLGACCASLSLAAPGFAAPERNAKQDKEATELTYAYADCVVGREHNLAAKAILANASNRDIMHRYSDLIVGQCLSRVGGGGMKMQFGGDLYRYALAGALVRADLKDRPLSDLKSVPPLEHLGAPSQPEAASNKTPWTVKVTKSDQGGPLTFLSQYGECVVRADPTGAKTLLFSKPMSPDEKAAFGAIMPSLKDCMPTDTTLNFGPLALRGSIAINYYRLAYAPRVATPTKTVN